VSIPIFLVDCCGHTVLDYVWLAGQCKFVLSLVVAQPVTDSLQVRECSGGRRELLEGTL
jgi:hypothetical protein